MKEHYGLKKELSELMKYESKDCLYSLNSAFLGVCIMMQAFITCNINLGFLAAA